MLEWPHFHHLTEGVEFGCVQRGVEHLRGRTDRGEGPSEHPGGEHAVDEHLVCHARGALLQPVQGSAVQGLEQGLPACQQLVGEVAVEDYPGGGEKAQDGHAGRDLVTEDHVRLEVAT